jgi:hypothetical protein
MLKLYPPRKGFSQNWRIRGTHGFGANRCRVDISARTHDRKKAEANLGCRIDQSSRTHRRHVAAAILAEIDRETVAASSSAGKSLSGIEFTDSNAPVATPCRPVKKVTACGISGAVIVYDLTCAGPVDGPLHSLTAGVLAPRYLSWRR